jgi:hypothetical protein
MAMGEFHHVESTACQLLTFSGDVATPMYTMLPVYLKWRSWKIRKLDG